MLDHHIGHAAIGFYMAEELPQGGYPTCGGPDAYDKEALVRRSGLGARWFLSIEIVDHNLYAAYPSAGQLSAVLETADFAAVTIL